MLLAVRKYPTYLLQNVCGYIVHPSSSSSPSPLVFCWKQWIMQGTLSPLHLVDALLLLYYIRSKIFNPCFIYFLFLFIVSSIVHLSPLFSLSWKRMLCVQLIFSILFYAHVLKAFNFISPSVELTFRFYVTEFSLREFKRSPQLCDRSIFKFSFIYSIKWTRDHIRVTLLSCNSFCHVIFSIFRLHDCLLQLLDCDLSIESVEYQYLCGREVSLERHGLALFTFLAHITYAENK